MNIWDKIEKIIIYREPPEKNIFELINQNEPKSAPGQVGYPRVSREPDTRPEQAQRQAGDLPEQASSGKQEQSADGREAQSQDRTKTRFQNRHKPRSENKAKAKLREGTEASALVEKERPAKEGPKRRRGDRREKIRPVRASAWTREKIINAREQSLENLEDLEVSVDLPENIARLKTIFYLPDNKDVIIREFGLGIDGRIKAAAVFIDGLTDKQLQNLSVFQPLMLLSNIEHNEAGENIEKLVEHHLLPSNQVESKTKFRDAVDGILMGNTAIFVDRVPRVFVVETKGWEHRQVEKPLAEMVIRGSQEAFTETLRINTGLIRKTLKSPNLVTEIIKVGKLGQMDCAIMYMKGITNPELVREVKRRIESLQIDYVQDSGVLEQMIEDNPFGIMPQMLVTERPDRVASLLVEGRVAIILDSNPFVLVVPTNIFGLLHSAEDTNLKWPYGSFLRLIRVLAAIVSLLLPGFYLALTNYHQEMLPTDLLMSIAGSRETVPFPSIVEMLIMEVSFELIREASVRMPGPMGPTIGIVGALILGQAAVSAAIVSPIMIIVVAVTAIGSFVIPSYFLSFSLRISRFGYLLLGFTLGFVGLAMGIFLQLILMVRLKSFGVPFLAPVGPRTSSGSDLVLRSPAWQQELRPEFINPLQIRRQPKISRQWIKRIPSGGGGE